MTSHHFTSVRHVFTLWPPLWSPYSYAPVSVLHTRRQRMVEWLKPHWPLSSALCIRSLYQLLAWWA